MAASGCPTVRERHALNDVVHRRVICQHTNTGEIDYVSKFLHNDRSRSLHRGISTGAKASATWVEVKIIRSAHVFACHRSTNTAFIAVRRTTMAGGAGARSELHDQIQDRRFKTLSQGRTFDTVPTRRNGSRAAGVESGVGGTDMVLK